MAWKERSSEIQKFLDQGLSYGDIAKHYGVARHTLRGKLKQLRDAGLIHYENRDTHYDEYRAQAVEESVNDTVQAEIDKFGVQREIDGKTLTHKSTRLLEMSEAEEKDPAFLLRAHGYNPDEWELVNSKSKMWHAYSKQDYVVTLYSSSITAKPKEHTYNDAELMTFFERLASTYQSPIRKPANYAKDGKLLELNIADLHLGKLAWAGDSGDTYNHEIARERFFYIINDVLDKTDHYSFERILFVWCNDYFHFDGPGKTTTRGTPQDTSLQFEQMFELGAEMLVQAVDLLTQIAPVTTLYTASNHDRQVSFFATKYLHAWYRDNKHVTVDSRPIAKKVVRFGMNLTGLTHGHLEQKRMGAWMAADYAKDWGETLFHEVHAAHIHSQRAIIEENGQTTRFMSSPTGTDRWHSDASWTGAIERAQSFVYDREVGIENVVQSTIPILGPKRESIII